MGLKNLNGPVKPTAISKVTKKLPGGFKVPTIKGNSGAPNKAASGPTKPTRPASKPPIRKNLPGGSY